MGLLIVVTSRERLMTSAYLLYTRFTVRAVNSSVVEVLTMLCEVRERAMRSQRSGSRYERRRLERSAGEFLKILRIVCNGLSCLSLTVAP